MKLFRHLSNLVLH